jgi:hypothetical protein
MNAGISVSSLKVDPPQPEVLQTIAFTFIEKNDANAPFLKRRDGVTSERPTEITGTWDGALRTGEGKGA